MNNYIIGGLVGILCISMTWGIVFLTINAEPQIIQSNIDYDHYTIRNISQEECFNQYGGSWHVPKKECHTRISSWEIAKLGDSIYLHSNSEIRETYVNMGYTIFNSTDTETEIGFVLDVCNDFKITQSELFCLEKEDSKK